MVSELYILGDADHVREKIELYLLSDQLDSLRFFAKSLRIAVDDLAQRVQDVFSGDIIMVGGDDVLFCVPKERFSRTELKVIAEKFSAESGCTISFGVASDIKNAYVNLRSAKSRGGNIIMDLEEIS